MIDEFEHNFDARNIELVRTDGLPGNENIKVLKFKGEYFVQVLALETEQFKFSNTIQQYLNYQKRPS